MREISPAENWLLIILGLGLSGILYNYLFYVNGKAIVGAIYGVAIGLPIIAFERRAIFPKLRRRIDQLTSITYILAALLAYEILMSVGYASAGAPDAVRRLSLRHGRLCADRLHPAGA